MSDIKRKIYLDMDGVICDWQSQFKKYSGGLTAQQYEEKYGKKQRYLFVKKHSPAFYAEMPVMSDIETLLSYLKKYDVNILSHSTDDEASEGKLKWLTDRGIKFTPILVNKSSDKANFAEPNAILIDDKPENIKQFRDAGGIGILHVNANDTILKLKQLENAIVTESSYRLYNSILNPDIWNADGTLKNDVAKSLLTIAKTFYKDTEITAPLEDVLLLGSGAAYNWTPTSDLDIHLVVDFSKINKDTELVDAYTNLLKSKWNMDHDIIVNGHPVEVYIQDVGHQTNSLGIYSLKNKKWVKQPTYNEPKFDKESIKKKYKELSAQIEDGIKSHDYKKLEKVLNKLYTYRQSGLDKSGEFSTENIVFKLLRNTGYLDKLKDSINKFKDKDLSKI